MTTEPLDRLLARWQAAVRKVDMLENMLADMKFIDGVQQSTRDDLVRLLQESQARERELRNQVLGVSGS